MDRMLVVEDETPQEINQQKTIFSLHSDNLGAAILLSDGENFPEGFEENEVTFEKLSSLCDEDLILFGIKDKNQRKKMLMDFKKLPNQDEHLEKYLSNIDIQNLKDTILTNTQQHIENLKSSILGIEYKMILDVCEDFVIEDKTYTSSFVIRVLQEMDNYCTQMIEQLKRSEHRAKGNASGNKLILSTIVLGSITALGFGIYCKFLKK